jgi:hypothetical protein
MADPYIQTLLLQSSDDNLFELQAALAIILLVGIELSRQARAHRRNSSRLYLRHPQLLPNPRINTPWQRLYESQDDRAFITTMGFDVETFQYILNSGFELAWDETPIPRADVSTNGAPRIGARSLDAAGALGLVLHYLSSAMLEISLQEIFALVPTTVSCYLKFSQHILLKTLKRIPDAAISFPQGELLKADNERIRARHPRLVGAFGSIDGLALLIQVAEDPEVENATYNGWKSSHFISNVIVFSPRGKWLPIFLFEVRSCHYTQERLRRLS